MARCCGGSVCACLIVAGQHFQVSGSGTSQDPFILTGDVGLTVADNTTFDLSLSGLGTIASPWSLGVQFAATAKLDDLPDVNAPSPTNGHVLGYDTATGKWTNRAPTTAASGSVLHDTSLTGDGSGGTPLGVNEDPLGFLQTDAGGLGLTDEGVNSLVRHFGSTLDRDVAVPSPRLNTISVLDSAPGRQDYWTGSQWLPVTNGVSRSFGTELLQLSGPYVIGGTTTVVTRQVSAVTDSNGVLTVLSSTDLAGAAGVLSVNFQETGAQAYKAVLNPNIDHIEATCYRLTDGTPFASQTLTGTLMAYIY